MRKLPNDLVIALAYFHRYSWLAVMLGCIAIWTNQLPFILGITYIIYSIWTFIGYKCRWRHIFCSFQRTYRKSMTPYAIQWSQIRKRDAYGVSLLFIVAGFAMLLVGILYK